MVAGALVPLVRHEPWFDRARFRIEKRVFLLRRRYGSRESNGTAVPAVKDYSGETLGALFAGPGGLSRRIFGGVRGARPRSGPPVAVKVLNESAGQESWVRDRFAHEVAAVRSVEHPAWFVFSIRGSAPPVSRAWRCHSWTATPCARRSSGFLSTPARVARIVRQLGDALAEIHGHGIIHRDLKPENLILLSARNRGEQAVIIDFGTAGCAPRKMNWRPPR